MNILRHILITLLFLSLPIYGQAAVDLPGQCTMQMNHDMMPRGAMQMDHGHPCSCCTTGHEADLGGKMNPGHSGNCAQGCDTCCAGQPLAFLLFLPSFELPVALAQTFVAPPQPVLLARQPEACWRPPRLV